MCLFIYSFVYIFICSQEYCVKILIFLHVFVNFFCEYFYSEIIGFWNQIARSLKLEFDIMYIHAFYVLCTVTLPVHYDS